MSLRTASVVGLVLIGLHFCFAAPPQEEAEPDAPAGDVTEKPLAKTDAEWRKQLSAEQFRVLRKKGTERAFTGKYWNHHKDGVYRCAGCGQEIFRSDAKFESGTGWPSFYQPAAKERIKKEEDSSLGVRRVEVACSRCGGHLGHVFADGPEPTGLRYCINSVCLKFEAAKPSKEGDAKKKSKDDLDHK